MANKPASVILIFEDDPFLRMVAVEFVNDAGFETGGLWCGSGDCHIGIRQLWTGVGI